jgi:hypothetical protein
MSGSLITLATPKMFLGATGSAYISASLGQMEISSSNFQLKPGGDVIMSGNVTATSGEIGGFSITETAISSSNGNLILGSNGQITAKGTSHRIGGTITADVINATGSGVIGGFTIDANEIKDGTDISLSSQHKRLTINDTTFGNTGIQLEYNGGNPKAFIGKSNGAFVKFDSSDASSQLQISSSGFILGQSGSGATTGAFISGSKEGNLEISSSNFHMKSTGDVIMSGKVKATSGEIGGFTIGTDLSNSAGGSNGLVLKGASGQITASRAKLTGGKIAQFVFDDEAMAVTTGTQVNLAIQHTGGGYLTPFGDDGTGISLGGNADGNDPLDRNLPFVVAQSGNHPEKVYFFVGHKTGSFIEFNGDTKTVEISSSNFLFGGGGQFISGSGGNIEISSSNFHLQSDGDVIMSGKVTAESGEIGGFLIGANAISSSLTSKRGLILEPGESIRGYGNEVHSTKSSPGLFSFGVQAVAPPANTGRAFKSTTALANTNAGGGYATE